MTLGMAPHTGAKGHDGLVFVLAYHSFLGTGRYPTDVSLAELKSHLDMLKERNYRFVGYDDIEKGRIVGARNILITIDDGNSTVHRAYRTVFRPLGIKPLVAIYPHVIGKQRYALTWEQLGELAGEGCEIASHGYYHYRLDRSLYETRPEAFFREIVISKAFLETRLLRKVRVFVYPYGIHSAPAMSAIEGSGYTSAFTIQWGGVHSPLMGNDDRYELPRYMIVRGNWSLIFSHIERRAALWMHGQKGKPAPGLQTTTGVNE